MERLNSISLLTAVMQPYLDSGDLLQLAQEASIARSKHLEILNKRVRQHSFRQSGKSRHSFEILCPVVSGSESFTMLLVGDILAFSTSSSGTSIANLRSRFAFEVWLPGRVRGNLLKLTPKYVMQTPSILHGTTQIFAHSVQQRMWIDTAGVDPPKCLRLPWPVSRSAADENLALFIGPRQDSKDAVLWNLETGQSRSILLDHGGRIPAEHHQVLETSTTEACLSASAGRITLVSVASSWTDKCYFRIHQYDLDGQCVYFEDFQSETTCAITPEPVSQTTISKCIFEPVNNSGLVRVTISAGRTGSHDTGICFEMSANSSPPVSTQTSFWSSSSVYTGAPLCRLRRKCSLVEPCHGASIQSHLDQPYNVSRLLPSTQSTESRDWSTVTSLEDDIAGTTERFITSSSATWKGNRYWTMACLMPPTRTRTSSTSNEKTEARIMSFVSDDSLARKDESPFVQSCTWIVNCWGDWGHSLSQCRASTTTASNDYYTVIGLCAKHAPLLRFKVLVFDPDAVEKSSVMIA